MSPNPLEALLGQCLSELREINQKLTNPNSFQVHLLTLSTANKAYKLPYQPVPYNCDVVLEAMSTNSGIIYVGPSVVDVKDSNKSYPLAAGESIGYKVSNVSAIWVMAGTANDVVLWTVEV